jgi:cytoskeletal protein CcmA (bactofilin family)
MSTYCRGCGRHLRLSTTTLSASKKSSLGSLFGFNKKEPAAPTPAPMARMPMARVAPITYTPSQSTPLEEGATSGPRVTNGHVTEHHSLVPNATRELRVIECFDCRASHRASRSATSTQCPGCSAYIDLKDLEIKDRNTQRIRTRGNVEVTKKGALLTVYGTVAGSIYASGDVTLSADVKILGEIRCRRLIISKKVSIQCLQPVHTATGDIHGHMAGTLYATEGVHLSKTGVFEGVMRADQIHMEPGAVLNGQIQCQPAARAPRRSLEPSAPAALSEGLLAAAAVI